MAQYELVIGGVKSVTQPLVPIRVRSNNGVFRQIDLTLEFIFRFLHGFLSPLPPQLAVAPRGPQAVKQRQKGRQ